MGSYAHACLSDGRHICAFKNGVDDLFFVLFTRHDSIDISGPEAAHLLKHSYGNVDPAEARVRGFRTTVRTLRDRLDIMGVPVWAVADAFEQLLTERIEFLTDFRLDIEDLKNHTDNELALLKDFTWATWVDRVRAGISAGEHITSYGPPPAELGTVAWLMKLWDEHDLRYSLRAVLEALPEDEQITLDVHEVIEGGWLEPDVDPQRQATAFATYATQGGLPPIVLVEGRTDIEFLSAAFRLRRPDLADYIRFPDFAYKPEGGVGPLRQTVKAFAAAGIGNRVLALFDNDTAAHDAVRTVEQSAFPEHFVIAHLPELDLAREYPTKGPQGEHVMDVNGLAGSLEMYLGADVLTDRAKLRPVIWTGTPNKQGAYQGEVADKPAIHAAFRAKVAAALADASVMEHQDWMGLDLVLEVIVEHLRTLR